MPEDPAPPPAPFDAATTMKRMAVSSIKPLLFVAFAFFVFRYLFSNIGGPDSILTQLNEIATARGLITFVVATATVAGALILMLAAIITDGV